MCGLDVFGGRRWATLVFSFVVSGGIDCGEMEESK